MSGRGAGGDAPPRARGRTGRPRADRPDPNYLNFVTRFPWVSPKLTGFARRYRAFMCQFQDKNEGEAMKIGAFVLAAGLALPATASLADPITLAGDELRK